MTTIELIDLEIGEIKKDTNRGISKLNELLITLAKERGDARKLAKQYKTSYELSFIEKKAEKELELLTINNEKMEKGLEKGEKLEKITDAELVRHTERQLTKEYQAYRDKEAINEYLEPIFKAYENFVNGLKWDGKLDVKVEKFYNQPPM